ncbi:hypothetical protein JCM10450v2_003512 [Rhodotorula kratochvilovae]
MTAPSSAQSCVVCSSDSRTRCSACAAVGIDLFFCSAECQKLVWKAHRPVCARNPFPLPDVTADEVATFAATVPDSEIIPGTYHTLANRLATMSGFPYKVALERPKGPAYDATYPYKPLQVVGLRLMLGTTLKTRDRPAEALAVTRFFNSGAVLPLYELFEHGLLPEDPSPERWLAELLHCCLIVSALVAQKPPGEDMLDPRVRRAFVALRVFQEWIQAGMGTGQQIFIDALSEVDFFEFFD